LDSSSRTLTFAYVVFNKIKLYRQKKLLISSGETLVRALYSRTETNE
jgi:hypothetical protein